MIFKNYPKIRPELPKNFRAIYKQQYKSNRDGNTKASGMAQKMETWLHRQVAKDVKGDNSKRTLEIGAGTLNHLSYETTKRYDIVEPFSELFKNSPYLDRINNVYADFSEIDTNKKYDRITSIASFEHILNLPEVVAKSCLHLNHGGTLRTSIPNEGTLLWTLAWKITTGLEFRLKYGLDYGILMNYEHCNTATEIEEILHFFYQNNISSVLGLGKAIGLYRFYESSKPNIERATEYLNNVR